MTGYLSKCSSEEMRFSSKYNIWVTVKEYSQLNSIIVSEANIRSIPPGAAIEDDIRQAANYYNIKLSTQEIAREHVGELLHIYPNSDFYRSLLIWNKEYTEKQLAAIDKGWKERKTGFFRFTKK